MNCQPTNNEPPRTSACIASIFLLLSCTAASAVESTGSAIAGKILDESGNGVAGVMVSAIDDEHRKWTSVFTGADGTFSINGLRSVNHHVRTRLMGH